MLCVGGWRFDLFLQWKSIIIWEEAFPCENSLFKGHVKFKNNRYRCPCEGRYGGYQLIEQLGHTNHSLPMCGAIRLSTESRETCKYYDRSGNLRSFLNATNTDVGISFKSIKLEGMIKAGKTANL